MSPRKSTTGKRWTITNRKKKRPTKGRKLGMESLECRAMLDGASLVGAIPSNVPASPYTAAGLTTHFQSQLTVGALSITDATSSITEYGSLQAPLPRDVMNEHAVSPVMSLEKDALAQNAPRSVSQPPVAPEPMETIVVYPPSRSPDAVRTAAQHLEQTARSLESDHPAVAEQVRTMVENSLNTAAQTDVVLAMVGAAPEDVVGTSIAATYSKAFPEQPVAQPDESVDSLTDEPCDTNDDEEGLHTFPVGDSDETGHDPFPARSNKRFQNGHLIPRGRTHLDEYTSVHPTETKEGTTWVKKYKPKHSQRGRIHDTTTVVKTLTRHRDGSKTETNVETVVQDKWSKDGTRKLVTRITRVSTTRKIDDMNRTVSRTTTLEGRQKIWGPPVDNVQQVKRTDRELMTTTTTVWYSKFKETVTKKEGKKGRTRHT